jgi:hypothetical protein
MENIKQLRDICQKSREWCDTWHGRVISRKVSIYITWLFLKGNVTPNTATLIFLLSIIPACIFFLIGSKPSVLTGMLFLQIWYILDHVDGEIARYRNLSSLTGIYFDSIVHYIAHPFILICLGYGLLRRFNMPYIYLFASSGAVSTFLIDIPLGIKKAVLFDAERKKALSGKKEKEEKNHLLLRRIFSLLHESCTFPNIMDSLTIAAILEIFLPVNFVLYLVIYFGALMPIIWISKLASTVLSRELDTI